MSLKKIECLELLIKKLKCRTEFLQFLVGEKLITDDVMANTLHGQHFTHSTAIFTILNDLQKSEKLQLVDYEWTILPKELIRLTLVTESARKEFTYSV